ncbi:MAG: glycerophosphodiester phosphodiesterase [Longimicrobiales bacterium]
MSARPGCTYLAGAPLLVAHRGGSRLAPENTMAAFRAAVDTWGADMIETDVRLSADGHVMVIHDATVDRTTDRVGAVAGYTAGELGRMDAGAAFVDLDGAASFAGTGEGVPRLDHVLEAFPFMRFNVEAKEARVAGPLVEVVRRAGARERVLVAAEFEANRRDARGYGGPWGASRHQVFWFWLGHRLPGGGPYVPPVDILQVPETFRGLRIVSPDFVAAAHRRNLPVQVWTVDDPADMRRLLDWGVDGIQTDRPDLLARVLHDAVGRALPPGCS